MKNIYLLLLVFLSATISDSTCVRVVCVIYVVRVSFVCAWFPVYVCLLCVLGFRAKLVLFVRDGWSGNSFPTYVFLSFLILRKL